MRTLVMMSLCFSCVLAAPGPAQATPRETTRVVLRQADGTPWKSATVHFVSRVIGPHHELPGADHQRSKSDARGRASAELLAGRSYSVWAHGDPDQDRRYLVSHVVEGIRAGDVARMFAKAEGQRQFEVKIAGLDAWRELAPVRLRLISSALQHRWLADVALEGDRALLPPSPAPRLFLQFLSEGEDIGAFWQELAPAGPWTLEEARAAREQLNVESPVPPEVEGEARYGIALAPPRTFEVLVTGEEDKPLPNSTVFRDVTEGRGPWQECSKTDENGIAELILPGFGAADEILFSPGVELLVRCEGYADNILVHHTLRRTSDPKKIPLADGDAPALLLEWKDGEALPHEQLVLYSSITRGRKGSGQVAAGPFRFRTNASGAAKLTGRSRSYAATLALVPSKELFARLPRSEDHPLAPLVPLGSWVSKDGDFELLPLSEYVPVDIEIRRADGQPARDGWLWLGDTEHAGTGPHYAMRFRLARDGRLRVLLPPKSKWVACFAGPELFSLEQLEVPETARPHTATFQVEASRVAQGVVLGEDGSPHAFAPVWLDPFSWPGRHATRLLFNWRTMMSLATNGRVHARHSENHWFPNSALRSGMWRWHTPADTFLRSDARGRYRIALPEVSKVSLGAVSRPGTPLARSRGTQMPAADGQQPDITLRLKPDDE